MLAVASPASIVSRFSRLTIKLFNICRLATAPQEWRWTADVFYGRRIRAMRLLSSSG